MLWIAALVGAALVEAMLADRKRTGDVLGVSNHTKPYVFSHKVAPGVDVGNLERVRASLACAQTRPPL